MRISAQVGSPKTPLLLPALLPPPTTTTVPGLVVVLPPELLPLPAEEPAAAPAPAPAPAAAPVLGVDPPLLLLELPPELLFPP